MFRSTQTGDLIFWSRVSWHLFNSQQEMEGERSVKGGTEWISFWRCKRGCKGGIRACSKFLRPPLWSISESAPSLPFVIMFDPDKISKVIERKIEKCFLFFHFSLYSSIFFCFTFFLLWYNFSQIFILILPYIPIYSAKSINWNDLCKFSIKKSPLFH